MSGTQRGDILRLVVWCCGSLKSRTSKFLFVARAVKLQFRALAKNCGPKILGLWGWVGPGLSSAAERGRAKTGLEDERRPDRASKQARVHPQHHSEMHQSQNLKVNVTRTVYPSAEKPEPSQTCETTLQDQFRLLLPSSFFPKAHASP